mmetsp:Transcript_11142/g.34638  ORF Transcript_11142/g.34638 Transcript_11142/m.34638 type:complete len:204 (-) Transcript_11142:9-620(-)
MMNRDHRDSHRDRRERRPLGGQGAAPAPAPPPLTSQSLIALPPPGGPSNCFVASGLPWYVTEAECARELVRFGNLRFARLYADRLNGSSRGMLLVRFATASSHANAVRQLRSIGPHSVLVREYVIHDRWDPLSAPPPLPTDPARGTVAAGKPLGYGPACLPLRAVAMGDANTVSAEGVEALSVARKKWRTEFEARDGDDAGAL